MKTKRRTIIPALLCMVISVITSNAQPTFGSSGTTRAIIVGISTYKNIEGLNFADRDARAFRNFLMSTSGGLVDSANIELFVNEEATHMNVGMAIEDLIKNSKSGDKAIIFFSGHGGVESSNYTQPPFLLFNDCPAEVYSYGGALPVDRLDDKLLKLASGGVDVLLIADACRSGKLASGSLSAFFEQASNQLDWGHVVKILSSGEDQLSQEDLRWGNGMGVFTYYLIDAMMGMADMKGNHDLRVSAEELEDYMQDTVKLQTNGSQRPKIYGDEEEIVAFVNESVFDIYFDQRKTVKEGSTDLLAFKGTMEDILATVGDDVQAQYELFEMLIDSGKLVNEWDGEYAIEWETDYAMKIYRQLEKNPEALPLISHMKRDILSALLEKSNYAIGLYLQSKMFTDYVDYGTDLLEMEMDTAVHLLAEDHILYNTIKAKSIYLKGVLQDDSNAVAYYKEALKYEPFGSYIYSELGLAYSHLGYTDSALLVLKKATELSPTWAYAWVNLGTVYDEMYDFDMALEAYQQSLSLDSTIALTYNNISIAYEGKKDYEAAIEWANKCIQVDSNYTEGYYNLAMIYDVDLVEYDQAIKYYEKAISTDSSYVDAWYNLSLIYQDQERYELSNAVIRRALNVWWLVPTENLYFNLAYNCYNLGDYDSTLIAVDFAIEYNPDDSYNYYLKGLAYNKLSNYEEAIKWYLQAIKIEEAADYYNGLGTANQNLDRNIIAEKYFKKAIALDSAHYRAWYNLGSIYFNQKNFDQAAGYYLESVKIDSGFALVDFEEAVDSIADNAIAIGYYNQYFQFYPPTTDYYSDIAWRYFAESEFDQALSYFDLCIELEPEFAADYIYFQAYIHTFGTQDYLKAKELYEQYLNSNTDLWEGFCFDYSYNALLLRDYAVADEYMKKAYEFDPTNWSYSYNLTCSKSLQGKTDEALEWFETSLKTGYNDLEHIHADTDLDHIRNTKEFEKLIKKYL